MKHFIYQLLAVTLFMVMATTDVAAKRVVTPKMYMFGFAASFNDSTVYFTDIQELDSVWMDSKSKFLLGREYYSGQLRNYLKAKQQKTDRTCLVMFHKNKAKLEKKYLKLKRLYTTSKDGSSHFDVQLLNNGEFSFKTIDMYVDEVIETEAEEAPDNSKKKKSKKKGGK